MKYRILIITALLAYTLPFFPQSTIFPVKNYTTRDYGWNYHPMNMSIVQDNRGLIYSANGFMLMEYDGSSWNSYPINKKVWIISLAVDRSGIVYAGSQNEFGMFLPDMSGKLAYISISDSLEIEDSGFTNIWKVNAFSEGVAFQAEEKLFIWSRGKIRAINPGTSFHTSFSVNDVLYVRERGKGILQWKNDRLEMIKGSEIFDTVGIFMMAPYGSGEVLIGTRDTGFWTFDQEEPEKGFRKFHLSDEGLVSNSMITGGKAAQDGSFAISTSLSGIILIDSSGTVRSVIDKNTGLIDNDIKDLALDKSGNLWLATNNGISNVAISSPLTFCTEDSGLEGSIFAVLRHKELLYAATNTGLFVQDPGNRSGKTFRRIPGINFPVRSLVEAEGSLIAGTDRGLFVAEENKVKKISESASFKLHFPLIRPIKRYCRR